MLREQPKSLGFTVSPYVACLFNCIEIDGTQTSVIIHVDDMFVSVESELHIDEPITEQDGLPNSISFVSDNSSNYFGMTFDFKFDGKVEVPIKFCR